MSSVQPGVRSFGQTEINWDKLDKTKFYVVGAGLFTGVTVALYPISVVKTRMQVVSKEVAERSAASIIKNILKTDGVPGLYRGFGTVITGAIPARIIFLTSLETIKAASFKLIEPFKLSEPTQAAIANGAGGMTASLLSQAVFVPIDVPKVDGPRVLWVCKIYGWDRCGSQGCERRWSSRAVQRVWIISLGLFPF